MPLRILDHLEEWLIAFLMGAATLLIFVAVVHRYAAGWHYPAFLQFIQDFLLKINLGWAQELCIYMFIWMAKFGAAYGVRHGTHVGVDVLVRALPPAKARWLTIMLMNSSTTLTLEPSTYPCVNEPRPSWPPGLPMVGSPEASVCRKRFFPMALRPAGFVKFDSWI